MDQVRWGTTRAGPSATDPSGPAPLGGNALIATALAVASAASGFRFTSDGSTPESASGQRASYEPDRYGARWAPVLFVRETANEQADFGVDIVGLGGSSAMSWGDHPNLFVTGAAQLNTTKLGAAIRQPRGPLVVQAVILREVGHLLGLAHVNDPTQLMYARGSSATDYGTGDLAGLEGFGTNTCALTPPEEESGAETVERPPPQLLMNDVGLASLSVDAEV